MSNTNLSFQDYIDMVLTKNTALQLKSRVNVRNYVLSNKVLFEVYFTAYTKHIHEVN